MLFLILFNPLFLYFPADLTEAQPEGSQEIANIENDNSQFDDLEYLTCHDLASDQHYIIMDVICLSRIVLYDPVNVPLKKLFV